MHAECAGWVEPLRNIRTHHICVRLINAANMSREGRNLVAFGRPSVRRVWGHGMAVFGPNLLGV